MTQTTTTAVCSRSVSKPFNTAYGERVKAEFTSPDGKIIPIFADADDPVFSKISKGCTVELVNAGRGWKVGRVGGQWSHPMPPQSAQAPTMQPYPPATGGAPFFAPPEQPKHPQQERKERSAAIAEKGREALLCLAFFFREVQQNETLNKLSEEGQRQMAVTAFIHSQK